MTLVHLPRRAALALAILAVAALAALAAVPAIAADVDVSIADKSFSPTTITVAQGDTVTWTVTKAIPEPHSVTGGTPQSNGQGAAKFDSGIELDQNGETFAHTFDTPGVFDYFCEVHPVEMTGKVIVLAPGQSVPAVEPPPSEQHTGVANETKLTAAVILAIAIVLMFGLAVLWRRMNPA